MEKNENENNKLLKSEAINIDVSLLILRLSVGGLILLHGIGKLQDLTNGNTNFFDEFDPCGFGGYTMLLLAVISEFLCSLLVIFGVFFRIALIPLIVTMVMAFFVFHANDDLMDKELPLVYLICLVVLMLSGAGKYKIAKFKR